MGIFKYKIKALCLNCKSRTILKIPNGVKIVDHIMKKKAKCFYCKCSDFEYNSVVALHHGKSKII
jgi:hypothetical protein|tara:strand:- start:1119 stop:1313 length:195 start_codon:yes stop_codon:yes gene_type:complete